MSSWSLRLWRRRNILPGVRVNLSKAGPSLSFGPRGAHLTVGRRGIRETVGIPGTGLWATRTLPPAALAPTAAPDVARPHAGRRDYLAMLALALGLGVAVALSGGTPGTAGAAFLVAALVGCGYEWLAHHHPILAKRLMALAGGLLIVTAALAALLAVAALVAGAASGRRR